MIDFLAEQELLLAVYYRRMVDEVGPALQRAVETHLVPALDMHILDILQSIPRPSVHPFVWSPNPAAHRRAARWYFAALARGEIPTDGTRYLRSGRMAADWTAETRLTEDGTLLVGVVNDAPAASYVYGSDTFRQVPGHRTTGWPYVVDALDELIRSADDQIIALWPVIIEEAHTFVLSNGELL
ncbi:MAG: hypothetical protein OHK0046_45980 [Anaerolineae bacterium]